MTHRTAASSLRDGEPSEAKRHKPEGLSTMVISGEIRLKSRPVGMPSADNFELATVSVPRPTVAAFKTARATRRSGALASSRARPPLA